MTQDPSQLEEIKKKLRIVCICKGIKQDRICRAIKNGSSTVEEVNRKTGSGTGGCKATRCGPVIRQLLEEAAKAKTD